MIKPPGEETVYSFGRLSNVWTPAMWYPSKDTWEQVNPNITVELKSGDRGWCCADTNVFSNEFFFKCIYYSSVKIYRPTSADPGDLGWWCADTNDLRSQSVCASIITQIQQIPVEFYRTKLCLVFYETNHQSPNEPIAAVDDGWWWR